MTAPLRPLGRARPRWAITVAGCAALALASLAVPSTLGYDPWAWLVWGREIGRGALDTTGGPSWKPLPVAVTTLVAPLGDLAVPVYAVLARTAALLAVVAVGRLAARLAGPGAAAFAVVALVLTPDGDPRFVRLVLEGHEAPWSAGLAVAALSSLLDRRPGRALAATWLLALLRPEAWPFLLALATWSAAGGRADGSVRSRSREARRGRSSAAGAALALASIPVLWFVPDWIGSGSPFHGAATAQVLADDPAGARLVDGVATAAGMVPVLAWALAAAAVVARWRRGDRAPAALAAAAGTWAILVVAMAAVLGYAAISRFFLPSAAVVAALAGVGAVDAARALAGGRRGALAVGLAVVTLTALAAPRLAGIPAVVDEVAERGQLADDLDEVIDRAGGEEPLASCGAAVVTARTLLRSAAAWHLDLPLHVVERSVLDRPAVLLLESERAIRISRGIPERVELASVGRWTAFASACPSAEGG